MILKDFFVSINYICKKTCGYRNKADNGRLGYIRNKFQNIETAKDNSFS